MYEPEYTNVPEPDYSPPTSPKGERKLVINVSDNQTRRSEDERQESGIYNKVITMKANEFLQDGAQTKRVSGEYTTNIKVAPGAVNVMPKMNEIPKLRKVDPASRKDDIPISPQSSPREPDREQKRLSVKQIQENMENIYVNEVKENTDLSQRTKSKAPPPPISPKAPPPPPSPVPLSPAPPPPPPDFRVAGGRLKQVHWNRIPKPLVRIFINAVKYVFRSFHKVILILS